MTITFEMTQADPAKLNQDDIRLPIIAAATDGAPDEVRISLCLWSECWSKVLKLNMHGEELVQKLRQVSGVLNSQETTKKPRKIGGVTNCERRAEHRRSRRRAAIEAAEAAAGNSIRLNVSYPVLFVGSG